VPEGDRAWTGRPTLYDDRLHLVYAEGRALRPEAVLLWRDVLERLLPRAADANVLDLGSGTGRFSTLLALYFARHVYAVEPSARMQSVASLLTDHPGVVRIRGRAEAIPLVDDLCDVAFLSQVLHHITDLDACARELERVVRRDGVVFIRNTFRDRLSGIRMYEFFPRALDLDNQRLLSLDRVVEVFAAHSFEALSVEAVHYPIDPSLHEHVERVRLRASSVLEFLRAEEIASGMRDMENAAAAEPSATVSTRVDVLVLRRCL
jgi:ubiquinone/menaquinone biosynthesis C-methylase UbiE